MSTWFYSVEGSQSGPVAWDEIVRLARDGQITAETYVWRDGWPEWRSASSVEGLIPGESLPQAPTDPSGTTPSGMTPTSTSSLPPIQSTETPPGSMGQSSYPSSPEKVNNHLVKAILVTLFCCLPLGIVSIVYAAQVNGRVEVGDIDGARKLSETASNWGNASIIAGILSMIGYGILSVIGASF